MTLARDPDTGHLIGIEQTPASTARLGIEFPKWVEPHPSHIDTTNGHISVADFEHHIDRAGNVRVLVKDAAQEAEALAQKSDKPRLHVVPDAPADVSAGEPLSPLWPKAELPKIEPPLTAQLAPMLGTAASDHAPPMAESTGGEDEDIYY